MTAEGIACPKPKLKISSKLREGNVFTGICSPWGGGVTQPPLPDMAPASYGLQAGGTHPTGMFSCLLYPTTGANRCTYKSSQT